MKVVFLPDYGDSPYQKMLKEKLFELGITVYSGLRTSFLPLIRSFLKYRPKIVHLHWTNPYLLGRNVPVSLVKSIVFIFEILLCRLLRIKIVWTIHNLGNHEKIQCLLEAFFNRKIAIFANALITHSLFGKKASADFYGVEEGKISVVAQGNYISFYPNEVSAVEARKRLSIGKEERVFLFFGNIRKYKGVLELVKAFRKIKNKNLILLIAGKPYDESIRKEVEESAFGDCRIRIFLEFIRDSEVQIYMNASDIVVLPYLNVTTSGALLLAFSFGKPVIAPSLGYIMDVMDPGGGFIYDSNDPEGLFMAMKKAIDSNLSQMGKFNLARAREYSWEDSAKKTLDVYRSLLR